jgi:hypothetical protein
MVVDQIGEIADGVYMVGHRQPEPAYLLNLEARINTVLRKWQSAREHCETKKQPRFSYDRT